MKPVCETPEARDARVHRGGLLEQLAKLGRERDLLRYAPPHTPAPQMLAVSLSAAEWARLEGDIEGGPVCGWHVYLPRYDLKVPVVREEA